MASRNTLYATSVILPVHVHQRRRVYECKKRCDAAFLRSYRLLFVCLSQSVIPIRRDASTQTHLQRKTNLLHAYIQQLRTHPSSSPAPLRLTHASMPPTVGHGITTVVPSLFPRVKLFSFLFLARTRDFVGGEEEVVKGRCHCGSARVSFNQSKSMSIPDTSL